MKNIVLIKYLLIAKSIIWTFLAVIYAYHGTTPNLELTQQAVVLLLLINAMIFLGLSLIIERKLKAAYWLTLSFVLANVILTVTDQFGLVDFLSLMVDVAILSLMVAQRKDFTEKIRSGRVSK